MNAWQLYVDGEWLDVAEGPPRNHRPDEWARDDLFYIVWVQVKHPEHGLIHVSPSSCLVREKP